MKRWPNVLCINSYAGSLVLGARAIGAKIVGSYEDAGYGLPIQQANFPRLNYLENLDEWPEKLLSDTVVIAHPPCSAFSKNNFANNARGVKCMGTKTDAFACTVKVLKYAMRLRSPAILIESVPDAMEGARDIHDRLAADFNYSVYRILQNACCFGTAQWRPRFWAVFTRKRWPELRFSYQPLIKTVSDVVEPIKPNAVEPDVLRSVALQFEIMKSHGWTSAAIKKLLLNDDYGYLAPLIKRFLGLKASSYDVHRQYFGGWYENNTIRKLPPNGFTSTLLGGQVWFYRGEPLAMNRWKALMGFPPDYIFPGRYAREFRTYLSKGVCPPVAAWILKNVLDQLSGSQKNWDTAVKPNEVLDLNVRRSQVEPYKIKESKPVAASRRRKTPAPRPPARGEAKRWRVTELLFPRGKETHNATVLEALRSGGRRGLTFNELVLKMMDNNWQTTSTNPRNIARFHLYQVVKLGYAEVVK